MSIDVITIDGPSGSGKGTLASKVAQYYGYHLLDSGALYRLLGLSLKKKQLLSQLDTKLADDTITAEERTRLKELQAYSIDLFDTEAREAGRFLAMLNRIYQKSLFT